MAPTSAIFSDNTAMATVASTNITCDPWPGISGDNGTLEDQTPGEIIIGGGCLLAGSPTIQVNQLNASLEVPDPFYFYEVEQLTFLGILLFVIVAGNLAVLGAIVLGKTQRKSRMNFFIMHLALADMAVGLINVLTDIIWKLTVTWYLGNVACKLVKYFQTVVIYSSNYVLVALSIDRYDAITHPLKFSGSWRRARVLVAMAWGLSFLFATPALFMFGETKSIPGSQDVTQCWAELQLHEWQIYITIVFAILFLIPAIIIAVCYAIMVHTIWTQPRILNMHPPRSRIKNSSSSGSSSNGLPKKSTYRKSCALYEDDTQRASSRGLIPKAKIKSVKMTFVIVFVFILCSSPYFVFSLLQVYGFMPKTKAVYALATFFQSLSPLNSAANPIIYCLFSTNFFRNFRKIKCIDWLAIRFCPQFGRPSPGASLVRRKYGHGPTNNNHPHCIRNRSDFTSSASMKNSTRTGSPRLAVKNGMVNGEANGTMFGKEVHFHPGNSHLTPEHGHQHQRKGQEVNGNGVYGKKQTMIRQESHYGKFLTTVLYPPSSPHSSS